MRKTISLLILVHLLSSCTESFDEEVQDEFGTTEKTEYSDEHSVRYNDVLTLVKGHYVGNRAAPVDYKVECLTDQYNDTVLFVHVKPSGGWVMYSSDTRVPAIVAQSDCDSFDNLMKNEAAKLWIQSIVEDLSTIKRLSDEELNFSRREIADNQAFWKSISSPNKFVNEELLSTNSIIGFPNPPRELPTGHYEYRYSTSYTEDYDVSSHIITTKWHQGDPYNIYCPWNSDYSAKAPAGCVAIAAAQVLFYLHEKIGAPKTAPSTAFCQGNIYSYYWSQDNYTESIWNEMKNDGEKAAPLIANIGKRINMMYDDRSSGAFTKDLVKNVFAPYGITCKYVEYNTDLLKNSLINDMPVIISAYSVDPIDPNMTYGHSFIADRYKRTRVVTKNHYEWVYDAEYLDTLLPMVPDKIEYTYSSPVISMISFNWGWKEDQEIPNDWYGLTSDWIINDFNYNIKRYMIYGYKTTNK